MKIGFIFSISILLFACSKSNKIEKIIPGNWNVVEFYNSVQSPSSFNDTTVFNVGNLIFENNGTGEWAILGLNTNSFTWKNDAQYVYLTSNNNMDTLQIVEYSKNKLVLQSTDVENVNGLTTFHYIYTLTK